METTLSLNPTVEADNKVRLYEAIANVLRKKSHTLKSMQRIYKKIHDGTHTPQDEVELAKLETMNTLCQIDLELYQLDINIAAKHQFAEHYKARVERDNYVSKETYDEANRRIDDVCNQLEMATASDFLTAKEKAVAHGLCKQYRESPNRADRNAFNKLYLQMVDLLNTAVQKSEAAQP
jgi:hypothetical protein